MELTSCAPLCFTPLCVCALQRLHFYTFANIYKAAIFLSISLGLCTFIVLQCVNDEKADQSNVHRKQKTLKWLSEQ